MLWLYSTDFSFISRRIKCDGHHLFTCTLVLRRLTREYELSNKGSWSHDYGLHELTVRHIYVWWLTQRINWITQYRINGILFSLTHSLRILFLYLRLDVLVNHFIRRSPTEHPHLPGTVSTGVLDTQTPGVPSRTQWAEGPEISWKALVVRKGYSLLRAPGLSRCEYYTRLQNFCSTRVSLILNPFVSRYWFGFHGFLSWVPPPLTRSWPYQNFLYRVRITSLLAENVKISRDVKSN